MTRLLLHASACLLPMLAAAWPALAQDAPRAVTASPDVYKVIAESETHRIILVTWKAGQHDEFHSHPGGMGVYYLTDCSLSGRTPDTGFGRVERKAGHARFQAHVKSHLIQNVGNEECRLLLFEPK